jgi:hypothetical protein
MEDMSKQPRFLLFIAEWHSLLHLQRRASGIGWGSERDQQDRTPLSRNVFGPK